MIRSIHPFPARMAPELAISRLQELPPGGLVLDPMAGSGTVVRHASELGHRAIGFDLDPLAVLMTRVWTTPVDNAVVERIAARVLGELATLPDNVALPWIDEDEETSRFVEYWFAEPQRSDLRRLAYLLTTRERPRQLNKERTAADVLRIALSRIIVTKDQGASLGRDVSHSRPHKVAETSSFQVIPAFERSLRQVCRLLADSPPAGNVEIELGDARSLRTVEYRSIDAVMTSPPYLNAIDYMRGHRLSLVWFGHRLSDLREIRSASIGAERGPDARTSAEFFQEIREAMGPVHQLSSRHAGMATRYAEDVYRLTSEIARVLKPQGRATLVVGNSCLKGVFIRNSAGVTKAASMVGLKLLNEVERELPNRSRYLPMPSAVDGPLGKRIRTETILTFAPI